MDVLVPFLATCTALEFTTIVTVTGTAVAANINRLVEVTMHTFDGSVCLSNLFARRNVFESHPEDFRLIIGGTSGAHSKIEALGVEGIWNTVAVVT